MRTVDGDPATPSHQPQLRVLETSASIRSCVLNEGVRSLVKHDQEEGILFPYWKGKRITSGLVRGLHPIRDTAIFTRGSSLSLLPFCWPTVPAPIPPVRRTLPYLPYCRSSFATFPHTNRVRNLSSTVTPSLHRIHVYCESAEESAVLLYQLLLKSPEASDIIEHWYQRAVVSFGVYLRGA